MVKYHRRAFTEDIERYLKDSDKTGG